MIVVTTNTRDQITGQIRRVRQQLRQVPQQAYDKFVDLTPVRSGNARRRTRLRGDVIEANYAYAERLDQGWSRQAPQGMTRPWQAWLDRQLRRIFGK